MSILNGILLILALLLLMALYKLFKLAKEYNHVDWDSRLLNFVDGLCRYYCFNFHNLKSETFELPKNRGVLLISNHMSGVDPLLLIASCKRPLRFMIAKEEYNRFGLKWLFKKAGCIPVDRTGRADIAFRQAIKALKNNQVIALFPHGRIHLDNEQPYRTKGGIKRLSELTHSPIFIARITGVKGQGSVFTSLFLRSNSHIKQYPSIDWQFFSQDDSLHLLGELLLGHRESLDQL